MQQTRNVHDAVGQVCSNSRHLFRQQSKLSQCVSVAAGNSQYFLVMVSAGGKDDGVQSSCCACSICRKQSKQSDLYNVSRGESWSKEACSEQG